MTPRDTYEIELFAARAALRAALDVAARNGLPGGVSVCEALRSVRQALEAVGVGHRHDHAAVDGRG
jgi:hypothetical protein